MSDAIDSTCSGIVQPKSWGELLADLHAATDGGAALSQIGFVETQLNATVLPDPVDQWREVNGLAPRPGALRCRCIDPSRHEVSHV